jgi:bifunctional non-homologous end joining protein LigD
LNPTSNRSSGDPVRAIRAALRRLGAPQTPVDPAGVQVMKPETRDRPFTREGWLFELKYDGFRMLAAGGAGEARLSYKRGMDATRIFPEIARAVADLPFRSLILDGEAVVVDETGRPNFQKLQRRGLRTRAVEYVRAAHESPAAFFAFDLLAFEDFDLRPLPLSERKALLAQVLTGAEGPVRYLDHVPERGEDLYAAVQQLGLEGIVGKRDGSPYRGGYSADWLKIRVDQSADFAVVGFNPAPGGFNKLHLATFLKGDGQRFEYAGTVGTGFTNAVMKDLRARLDAGRRADPPEPGAGGRSTVWVVPELVAEVRYKELTEGGHLRHPVFLRLRDDKTVEECFRPGTEPEEAEAAEPVAEAGKAVSFTNLDKVFWPEEGYTKGDLIEYYRAVAPWMLRFLQDRPLMMDRYPDGIKGKSFFQRAAAPCEDVETLLSLVNLGAIPFHIPASREAASDFPDWCILDLDPKTAPFAHVVEIALAARDLCGEIEMPTFVKTSGGSGLHILLPMGGQLDHDRVRQLAELLARVLVDRLPGIATTARSISARRGRVYVDALQNGRGKLLAAPYSARPRPGATVSTPLTWREVDDRLDVGAFNIKTVPKRLQKKKDDPLLPVLTETPDLARALALLAERV